MNKSSKKVAPSSNFFLFFWIMSILLTQSSVTLIDGRGALLIITLLHAILHEKNHLVAIIFILSSSYLYRLWWCKSFFQQKYISYLEPIQNGWLYLRLYKFHFQRFILLRLIEVALKWNDDFVTAKDGHIIDDWQIIGIDVNLEQRFKIKAILMKETNVDCIITCATLRTNPCKHY